jgi:hypothetical protein
MRASNQGDETVGTLQVSATHFPRTTGADARERLLAELPVRDRRLEVAGVSTAVLEGGDAPPVVLLPAPASSPPYGVE